MLAQTSCLCQSMWHTPITLPLVILPQCICSYAYNTHLSNGTFSLSLGQAEEEPWIRVISALLSSAWQGKFLFNNTRKIQQLHFRSFNSLISFSFTIYLDDSLSGDVALDRLLLVICCFGDSAFLHRDHFFL